MKEEHYKEIEKYLDYNKETGIFIWSQDFKTKIKKGRQAGYKTEHGYITIGFKGKRYYAHRLAWYFTHQEIPKYVDHINGDGTDNKITNLRSCTQSQNCMNKKVHSNNLTGYKGVSYEKGRNRFRARIMIKGKKINIGSFKTAEEARDAYNEYAKKNQGEFYREL